MPVKSYSHLLMTLKTLAGKRPILLWNVALILPAAVSLYGGVRNALRPGYSEDFQWSGTHLTFHHIDPYRQFLLNDPGHLILMTQIPNYLHELYILLLPLGALTFASARVVWLILNCIFTIAILATLRRIYSLDHSKTLLLTLLLLASTPFRVALGAGTESLLELMFFCLFFYLDGEMKRGVVLGFSYLKYSFSPVLFCYLAVRRRYRLLAISMLPPLVGLVVMWLLVSGNLATLAIEPFAVSRTGVSPGMGDLMRLVHLALDPVLIGSIASKIAYFVAILASAGYAFYLARQDQLTRQAEVACLAVASLMFFPHLVYDFVFLIVPMAACLKGPWNTIKIVAVSACCLIFYGYRFIGLLGHATPHASISIIVVLMLLGTLIAVGRKEAVSPEVSSYENSLP